MATTKKTAAKKAAAKKKTQAVKAVKAAKKAPARKKAAVEPELPHDEDAARSAAGKSLVIVESPAKAKNIGKYLGRGYAVKATVGHIRDLPVKKHRHRYRTRLRADYVTIEGKGRRSPNSRARRRPRCARDLHRDRP
jgi:DNA topoisomerase-1